jgi:hypothetical protein
MAYYNPNQFEDLDLPWNPLGDAPDLEALAAPYAAASREPFLAQIDPYSKYTEGISRKKSNLRAEQELENIKALRLKALGDLEGLSKFASKAGFAGSGARGKLSDVYSQKVTSETLESISNIKKSVIGAKQGALTARERYSENLWDLYSDFLLAGPERMTPMEEVYGAGEDEGTFEDETYWGCTDNGDGTMMCCDEDDNCDIYFGTIP